MALYFPPNPQEGQRYVGTNGITYTWIRNRWNGILALEQGAAYFYYEGSDAFFEFDPDAGSDLDGGWANGTEFQN